MSLTIHDMPQTIRVLQLEDNPDDAELALRELKRAGFEIISQRVETEEAFVDGLNENLDFILSDFTLPEFDGMRALELLKRSRLDVPFIIVSGTIGEDIAVEAMKRGASDYLLKDRLARLGTSVQHAMEQRRLRKERLQAEEALRASEEKFRQLAESISEVSWITSADLSMVLYISPSYEKVWGRTCQSLYNNPRTFTEVIHGEDRDSMMAALQELMRGEKLDLEYRVLRPDGQIRWVHARCTTIRNESGLIYRLAGIAEDITERKRIEEEIKNQLHELQRWHEATLGREERILELKCEVNELLAKQLQPARYFDPLNP